MSVDMQAQSALFPRTKEEVDSLARIAKMVVDSGYFPDLQTPQQAAVKIMMGAALGLAPMDACAHIWLIKGRLAIAADRIAGMIQASARFEYEVTSLTDKGCALTFFERISATEKKKIGESNFNEGDAHLAGLLGTEAYQKWPRNMYFSRAIANGARWYCPIVFGGPVYTPDELGYDITWDGLAGPIYMIPTGVQQPQAAPAASGGAAPSMQPHQPMPQQPTAAHATSQQPLGVQQRGVTQQQPVLSVVPSQNGSGLVQQPAAPPQTGVIQQRVLQPAESATQTTPPPATSGVQQGVTQQGVSQPAVHQQPSADNAETQAGPFGAGPPVTVRQRVA